METDEKKLCKICGKMKFINMDFYMDKSGRFASECKACRIKINMAYAKRRNKKYDYRGRYAEYDKVYRKAYYEKHSEILKAKRRERYAAQKIDPTCRRKKKIA